MMTVKGSWLLTNARSMQTKQPRHRHGSKRMSCTSKRKPFKG
jgi:hypothetical protein